MVERSMVIDKLSVFLAESLGTGLLVFLGCLGCITWGNPYNHLQTVLSFGLVVLIVVQTFGCISGAHINPAVTVAATIFGLVDVKTAVLYLVAQFLGAFMGYGLIKTIVPADIMTAEGGIGLCVTVPNEHILVWQAFAVEFFATSAFVWFCCGIWDPRNAHFQDCTSLKFGLAVAGLAAVTGPFTGCSMNPARSFAPAVWNGVTQYQWIYWTAPLSAAVFASTIYKYVFRREPYELQKIHN